MPINEQCRKQYFKARDVFVESYVDFLRKLLGLLDEAEYSTEDADVRKDVVHFADEVKLLMQKIEDFDNEEDKVGSCTVQFIPQRGTDEGLGENSSPSKEAQPQCPTPVQLLANDVSNTTSTSEKSLQKCASADSTDEVQAEVESAPSQLSASEEAADEVPQVFNPIVDDDCRVVSAFCAFRYHKAEFRQLFMRQGNNNSSAATAHASRGTAVSSSSNTFCRGQTDEFLETLVPHEWLAHLAYCTLYLMRRTFDTSTDEHWEALKAQLADFGFKAEEHFALWLRLSAKAPQDCADNTNLVRVFNAIPPLTGLSKRLAVETKIMLQICNLLSQ